MNNLAELYQAQAQYAKAEPLHVKTLEVIRRVLGEEHPKTLLALNNLAALFCNQGEFTKAEPLFIKALEVSRRVLGEEHPNTLLTMNNLAGLYNAQGKFAKAEPLIVKVLEVSRRALGEGHPNTLGYLNNLAWLYQAQGQFANAEPLYREAVARTRQKLGLAHPDSQLYIRNLIGCHERMGQSVQAEPLLRELADFWKEQAGADSAQYAGQLAALGLNLLQQKKPTDAEPILRESLAIRAKKEPDAWTTFNTKSMLGGALLARRASEAEPLLLQGYEGMKPRYEAARRASERKPDVDDTQTRRADAADAPTLANQKQRLAEALERLVQLYEAIDKPVEAEKWRLRLEEAEANQHE